MMRNLIAVLVEYLPRHPSIIYESQLQTQWHKIDVNVLIDMHMLSCIHNAAAAMDV